MVAPFLTEQGLAKLNSNATDGFFAGSKTSLLSPTEAHDRLKRFLFDNFKFKTSFDVYAFLVPLTSANSTNTLWVSPTLLVSNVASLKVLNVAQTQEEGQV